MSHIKHFIETQLQLDPQFLEKQTPDDTDYELLYQEDKEREALELRIEMESHRQQDCEIPSWIAQMY
jgi:hypothetical protein